MTYLLKRPGHGWQEVTEDYYRDTLEHIARRPHLFDGWRLCVVETVAA